MIVTPTDFSMNVNPLGLWQPADTVASPYHNHIQRLGTALPCSTHGILMQINAQMGVN